MVAAGGSTTIEVRALLLSRITYGDADLIVHAFTDQLGKISALARGARRSQKRYGGSLEPMHTLKLELSGSPRGELYTIKGSQIAQPRAQLLQVLERMTAAGKALAWVKRAASADHADLLLWQGLNQTLDQLESSSPDVADDIVSAFGLRLLEIMGWGINFGNCVSCGKVCPEGKSAWINPERGGLVCRACGGGPFQMSGAERVAVHRVAHGMDSLPPHPAVPLTLKIVERALGAHLGWEDGGGIDARRSRR